MPLETFKDAVSSELTAFAWEQWSQLGIFAPGHRNDRWAADPEALLVFTLEIGRRDPRLLDEVLDWLLTNERLISLQRLRNLATDNDDRRLVEAAIGWVARWQPKGRFTPRVPPSGNNDEPIPLFSGLAREVRNPDPAFLALGLLKPDTDPSHKSQTPDPTRPINFAFRLRLLFGVGSRAEVIRYLITNPAPDPSAQMIAEAAGFAKRNVNETLTALTSSGLVTAFELGNEHRYSLNRPLWGQLFAFTPDTWPAYRDWPRLLQALRRLSRWLEGPQLMHLSPYLLASEARTLMDELEPAFAATDVPPPTSFALPGDQYWQTFTERVQQITASLNTWWG
jgi:hypothetical protein